MEGNKCVSCIKDSVTGQCYDLKDKLAREQIEKILNTPTGGKIYEHYFTLTGTDSSGRGVELNFNVIRSTEERFTLETFKSKYISGYSTIVKLSAMAPIVSYIGSVYFLVSAMAFSSGDVSFSIPYGNLTIGTYQIMEV